MSKCFKFIVVWISKHKHIFPQPYNNKNHGIKTHHTKKPGTKRPRSKCEYFHTRILVISLNEQGCAV